MREPIWVGELWWRGKFSVVEEVWRVGKLGKLWGGGGEVVLSISNQIFYPTFEDVAFCSVSKINFQEKTFSVGLLCGMSFLLTSCNGLTLCSFFFFYLVFHRQQILLQPGFFSFFLGKQQFFKIHQTYLGCWCHLLWKRWYWFSYWSITGSFCAPNIHIMCIED